MFFMINFLEYKTIPICMNYPLSIMAYSAVLAFLGSTYVGWQFLESNAKITDAVVFILIEAILLLL